MSSVTRLTPNSSRLMWPDYDNDDFDSNNLNLTIVGVKIFGSTVLCCHCTVSPI